MAAFTFEIICPGQATIIADVLMVPDERALWCQVEALALRIKNDGSASIQVKNRMGETVIIAGVATALASIERCCCTMCPLKTWLEQSVPLDTHAMAELGVDFVPCAHRRSCSFNVGGCSCKINVF
jgi:hypothetical protein